MPHAEYLKSMWGEMGCDTCLFARVAFEDSYGLILLTFEV